MDTDISFGNWLQKRRKMLDLTREEFAQRVGCSVSALRKIETDERRPSKQFAELLANILEVPSEERGLFIQIARGNLSIERMKTTNSLPDMNLLQQPPAFPSPIPIPPTQFIGRESELISLSQMLGDSQCRIITLVGPGGSGKTRLAIQIATEQYEKFRNVFYVPLAGLRKTEFIVPTIAEALHFTFVGSMEPRVQLLNHLKSKSLLLVLDNFEHLLDGANLLAEIYQQTSEIKLLVTSRERLNLHGEWLFEVQGLQFPSVDTREIMSYSAATLFVQSAHRASVNYTLKPDDVPAIARILGLVQGMPLGIELAASWIRTLSCHEIAQEVERNLDFLETPMRGIPDRHRSMRAVFDHSWDLLSETERRVLHQLSVFHGGFQRDAARQVAGADLSLLSALMDKSLLQRTSAGRYEVHELLRQYVEAKQSERAGELESARNRHSEYYGNVIARLHHELVNTRQVESLAEASAEMDNIRAAWQYAVQHRLVFVIQKFISGLWHFYEIRGWFREGYDTFQLAMENMKSLFDATDRVEPDIAILRADLRAHYAWFCLRLGQWGEASRLTQESADQLRNLGAWNELAEVLHLAGVALWGTGQYAEARVLLEEKIALDESRGNHWDLALGLGQLGLVYQGMGDYHQARELMRTAHGILEVCGDQRMVAVSFFHRAGVEVDLGELDVARELLGKSLELSTIVGDRWAMGTSRFQLGLVAQAKGEHEEAIRWFHEAQNFCRETGERWSTVRTLNGLGASLIAIGNEIEAGQVYREALSAAVDADIWSHALEALVGLSILQMKQNAPEAAFVTLEYVMKHPACDQHTSTSASRLRAEIEGQLTSQQIKETLTQIHLKPFDVFVREILNRW